MIVSAASVTLECCNVLSSWLPHKVQEQEEIDGDVESCDILIRNVDHQREDNKVSS